MAADEPPPPGSVLVGPLMRRWMDGLENRNANWTGSGRKPAYPQAMSSAVAKHVAVEERCI